MTMCEDCGVVEATVQLTQVIDEETRSFQLCMECARKRGIHLSVEEETAVEEDSSPEAEEPKCGSCGMEAATLRKSGVLGCPACYRTFENEISNLLLQVHGAGEHKGKLYHAPASGEETADNLRNLRMKLETAILQERFEDAALLRDAIHDMTGQGAP